MIDNIMKNLWDREYRAVTVPTEILIDLNIIESEVVCISHKTIVAREELHVGWPHCSHQEQEGVFCVFFFFLYILISPIATRKCRAWNDKCEIRSARNFGVHTPYLPLFDVHRPCSALPRLPCTSSSSRHPFVPRARPVPNHQATTADVNGLPTEMGTCWAPFMLFGITLSDAHVSTTWTSSFWTTLASNRARYGPRNR